VILWLERFSNLCKKIRRQALPDRSISVLIGEQMFD
jgi:hypothetical protein